MTKPRIWTNLAWILKPDTEYKLPFTIPGKLNQIVVFLFTTLISYTTRTPSLLT